MEVFIDQEDILIPVHPTAVPILVHPTGHPMAVPIPVHPTGHPMAVPIPVHPTAVPIPVHPTKFIEANDLLSQSLQNMVMDLIPVHPTAVHPILHPPITARLYMKLYMKNIAKLSM